MKSTLLMLSINLKEKAFMMNTMYCFFVICIFFMVGCCAPKDSCLEVNCQDTHLHQDCSDLVYSCYIGNINNVKRLLQKGVNPNCMYGAMTPDQFNFSNENMPGLNVKYWTPLIALAFSSSENKCEIAKILIDAGAQVNIKVFDFTPLACSVYNWKTKDNSALSLLLIEKGAAINNIRENNVSVLHDAVFLPNVLKSILTHGGDVNVADSNGNTPLHWAAMHSRNNKNCVSSVKILIDRKANVNATNNEGITPIDWVASQGNNNMVEVFNVLNSSGAKMGKLQEILKTKVPNAME